MYADKYVHTIDDVPNGEHFVIIKNNGVRIPGDERSRTNPGHGYPEHTENYLSYEVYLTKEKLLQAVEELDKRNEKNYRVLKVSPMTVMKQVSLSLV
jgi:hypothetical protein